MTSPLLIPIDCLKTNLSYSVDRNAICEMRMHSSAFIKSLEIWIHNAAVDEKKILLTFKVFTQCSAAFYWEFKNFPFSSIEIEAQTFFCGIASLIHSPIPIFFLLFVVLFCFVGSTRLAMRKILFLHFSFHLIKYTTSFFIYREFFSLSLWNFMHVMWWQI